MYLFLASSISFILLNTIENLIHYSIGRSTQYKDDLAKVRFQWPTVPEMFKIVVVMLIFAALQGGLTCLLEGC